MENMKFLDGPEMMRRVRRMIRWHVQSDLDIRVDRKLTGLQKKEIRCSEILKAKVDGAEYDFSFSGLKSAVLNYINGCKMKGESFDPADLAASFQKAVVEVLVGNSMKAAEELGISKFAIAGGVASNSALRAAMIEACEKEK